MRGAGAEAVGNYIGVPSLLLTHYKLAWRAIQFGVSHPNKRSEPCETRSWRPKEPVNFIGHPGYRTWQAGRMEFTPLRYYARSEGAFAVHAVFSCFYYCRNRTNRGSKESQWDSKFRQLPYLLLRRDRFFIDHVRKTAQEKKWTPHNSVRWILFPPI
jgi:hypothetical protein